MNQQRERGTYVSTRELMDTLSISRSSVYRLIAKGMPNLMVGTVHRFPLDQVIAWLEALPGAKVEGRAHD